MHNLSRKPVPAAPPAPPGSLAAALATVPDPRQPYGWRPDRPPLPLGGVLQVSLAAILCGARSLYAIAQWARERVEEDPTCLVALGLPPGRHPSVATLHRLFKALDVAALERVIADWLVRSGRQPVTSLAIDGKTLRGSHGGASPAVQLVAVYAQPAQAVLGQVAVAGPGQELAAVKQLLTQVPVADRLVTGDALQTQREVCRPIVERRGDYLLPVDENQQSLLAEVAAAFSPLAGDGSGRAGAADRPGLAGGRAGGAGRGPDGGG